MKTIYLSKLRNSTCYPTFRGFISIATIISYTVAVAIVIAGFFGQGAKGLVLGAIAGAVLALIAKVSQEVSLMVADIADATIDTASRQLSESHLDKKSPIFNTSTEQRAHAPVTEKNASRSDARPRAELMAKYGITYDGSNYLYSDCLFNSPQDAIQYAQSVVNTGDQTS